MSEVWVGCPKLRFGTLIDELTTKTDSLDVQSPDWCPDNEDYLWQDNNNVFLSTQLYRVIHDKYPNKEKNLSVFYKATFCKYLVCASNQSITCMVLFHNGTNILSFS